MTLVKRLVEMHGGSIEANSGGPGKGSEFVVRLPVVVEASRPQEFGTEAEQPIKSFKIRGAGSAMTEHPRLRLRAIKTFPQLIAFLRDETKFDTAELMARQIAEDVVAARDLLKGL